MHKNFVLQKLPTDFCHASSVIVLRDGSLLCAWFGGTREGARDTAIYFSRCTGAGWSEPRRLADGAEADWNPVLFYTQDGKLQLFYKEGQKISEWRTFVISSADDGLTWSKPQELVPGDTSGGRGPVRNKPLRLKNGRIVAGASTERGIWQAFADISDDDGCTWRKSSAIALRGLLYHENEKTAASEIPVSEQSFYGRGVIQPSLWQSSDGSVHMLLRSSEDYIYRSDSFDAGASWCDAYAIVLPNNNSGLDLARTRQGKIFLVCNPVAQNWGRRSPLSLFKSENDGADWQKIMDLETEPAEFSYPAVISHGDELIITYTWKRQNIACVRMETVNL